MTRLSPAKAMRLALEAGPRHIDELVCAIRPHVPPEYALQLRRSNGLKRAISRAKKEGRAFTKQRRAAKSLAEQIDLGIRHIIMVRIGIWRRQGYVTVVDGVATLTEKGRRSYHIGVVNPKWGAMRGHGTIDQQRVAGRSQRCADRDPPGQNQTERTIP